MTSSRMGESTVDDLVSIYAEAAVAHGRASREGDHEKANEQHESWQLPIGSYADGGHTHRRRCLSSSTTLTGSPKLGRGPRAGVFTR
jgi:hypothetical protein